MDLFDDAERMTLEPARHGESNWSYLDRSGRQEWIEARSRLTDWFSRMCAPMKLGVRNRLRSGDDTEFASALWELYLHEMFQQLGYEVTCEVGLPNGRNIDFLVTRAGQSMYVEATVARSSADALAADTRRNRVYTELDKLETTDFMLGIEVLNAGGDDMPAASRLRREVQQWLSSLDPDEAIAAYESTGALPSIELTAAEWHLRLEAIPTKPDLRGKPISRPLGMFMDETGGAIDDETRLKRALKRKSPSRYGDLKHPLVVAIAEYGWELSDSTWHRTNVLYGTSAVQVGPGDSFRSVRRPDGHWRGHGNTPRNGRLAAVLFGSRVFPWCVTEAPLEWWNNPFATRPVPDELVPQIARRQDLVIRDGTGSLEPSEPLLDSRSVFRPPTSA